MCEYGLALGVDFNLLKNERVQIEGIRTVTRTVDDAAITIDLGLVVGTPPLKQGNGFILLIHMCCQRDTWFPRMCEYGFSEGQDFCSFLSESYQTFLSNRSDGLPGKPRQDAAITIDIAKEICMLQGCSVSEHPCSISFNHLIAKQEGNCFIATTHKAFKSA